MTDNGIQLAKSILKLLDCIQKKTKIFINGTTVLNSIDSLEHRCSTSYIPTILYPKVFLCFLILLFFLIKIAQAIATNGHPMKLFYETITTKSKRRLTNLFERLLLNFNHTTLTLTHYLTNLFDRLQGP